MPSPHPTPLTTLTHLLAQIQSTLSTPNNTSPQDPLHALPPSITTLLPTRPSALIKLAHAKIHTYPFNEVPACWMRLYTEASLWVAVGVIRAGLGLEDANRIHGCGNGRGDYIGDKREAENGDGYTNGFKHERRRESVEGEGDWIQRAVCLLDMAVVMAGALFREGLVEALFSALQGYVEQRGGGGECVGAPLGRKRWLCDGEGEEYGDGGFTMGEGRGRNVPDIQRLVDTRTGMSMEAFERQLKVGKPVVIQGAMRHWPALNERPWKSKAYLLKKTFGGRRLVPVEVGRSYTDEGWGQRIVTFGEFMDDYLLQDSSHKPNGKDRDIKGIGYLAQHDLFTQIPSLRNDISIPDYCYTDPPPPAPGTPLAAKLPPSKLEEPMLNAWFGPAGTVSPLHTDPYHNVLCQIVGRKYVRLYAPSESEKVYPKGVEGGGVDMSNTSEVDVEKVDEERWPLFKGAEYVECILKEGECLYIPVGWWHYVRSLTVSFSVSFWWN